MWAEAGDGAIIKNVVNESSGHANPHLNDWRGGTSERANCLVLKQ